MENGSRELQVKFSSDTENAVLESFALERA